MDHFRCNCGHCVRELLQNTFECYCCCELEGCIKVMESEEVLQDFPPGTTLNCVTEHPGFNAVCLQKWSLKQSAWQYKTKSNRRYKQSVESEERYVVIQHDLEESFQKMPPYNLLYV